MVQRLHLTVEVDEQADGSYEAHCPELSISAHGRAPEEAVDRLKEMVFSSMAGGFDSAFAETRAADPVHAVLARHKHCYLHYPPSTQVH